MIQSGDGDWIINFRPSAIDSDIVSCNEPAEDSCIDTKEGFLFVPGTSRGK
jgi:hypothetical protein